jgi:hypothetical protein
VGCVSTFKIITDESFLGGIFGWLKYIDRNVTNFALTVPYYTWVLMVISLWFRADYRRMFLPCYP